MGEKELAMESTFSFRLWQSLFLIKLHVFTINGSERVVDELYFQLQALIEFDFSKAQAFTVNGSGKFCD